jgi:hypothetical protein
MGRVDRHRRDLAPPAFPSDDGSTPPAVAAAMAAYDADPATGHAAAVAALQDSRVLVPVVATLGQVEHDADGLAHDKSSDMATVLVTGRDGSTALLAFTSTATMASWNPRARPVVVPTRQAARAALQDGAVALVVDLAGPILLAIEDQDLHDLAAGLVLRRFDQGWGWTRDLPPPM